MVNCVFHFQRGFLEIEFRVNAKLLPFTHKGVAAFGKEVKVRLDPVVRWVKCLRSCLTWFKRTSSMVYAC
jgi:hypothetical protein